MTCSSTLTGTMALRLLRLSTTLHLAVFLHILFISCSSIKAEISTVVLDKKTEQLTIVEGYRDDYVAWANFTDDIEHSG